MSRPNSASLVALTAGETVRAVVEGDISAVEAVECRLARIAEANPGLNAVTEVLAPAALADAEAIDRRRRMGEPLGPLAGLPFTVKGNIDVAGSATTHGIAALRDRVPPADAPIIGRLRQAGAIAIGRTNLPDLSLRFHTASQLFGATVNPWDAGRTPGGSSGGEGVAVATGMSALGVGNDAGGSVRVPAAFNGVCGLKPTTGRLPSDRAIGRDAAFASQVIPVDGFLAPGVADLELALAVAAGPDPRDPRAVPAPLTGPRPTSLRVALVTDPGGMGVCPAAAEAGRRAAAALTAAGYLVEEAVLPRFEEALEAYGELIMTEFHQVWPMLEKLLSPDSRRYIELAMRLARPRDLKGYLELTAARQGIQRAWTEFLAECPLVLGPVYPDPPPPPDYDIASLEAHEAIGRALRLCAVTSLVGLPSVSVPVLLQDGLPQAVQVIGGFYREDLCLAAGAVIEASVSFDRSRVTGRLHYNRQ